MNVLVERDYLEAIADAIRARYGNDVQYTPAEMAPAILRIPGGEVQKVLSAIAVTTPPYKTTYTNGDTFDAAGMVVTAYYTAFGLEYGSEVISDYSLSPTTLTDGTTKVTITYSEGDVTATAAVSITVNPSIVEYTFVPPTKTQYVYGDTVDTTGMSLKVLLSNGTVEDLTNKVSISPTTLTTVTASKTIVATYKEKSWSFEVSVDKAASTLVVSNTVLTLSQQKPTGTVTVDGVGDGLVSSLYTGTDLSVSITNNIVTISKLSNTADGTYIVELQRGETDNYLSSAVVSIQVTIASSWEWGSSYGTPDLYSWLDGLRGFLATASDSDVQALKGQNKSITRQKDDDGNWYFPLFWNGIPAKIILVDGKANEAILAMAYLDNKTCSSTPTLEEYAQGVEEWKAGLPEELTSRISEVFIPNSKQAKDEYKFGFSGYSSRAAGTYNAATDKETKQSWIINEILSSAYMPYYHCNTAGSITLVSRVSNSHYRYFFKITGTV